MLPVEISGDISNNYFFQVIGARVVLAVIVIL